MILPRNLADWSPEWLELYSERAGIMEYLAGMSKKEAEYEAEKDIRKQAINSQFPKDLFSKK